jgi:hypothetical protein
MATETQPLTNERRGNIMIDVLIPGENIITVTQGGLLYRDVLGVTQWIDFIDCRDKYLATVDNATRLDRRYVGCRNTEQSATIYVRFFSETPVIFSFKNAARRNLDLIQPLSRVGWYTTICVRSTEALPVRE